MISAYLCYFSRVINVLLMLTFILGNPFIGNPLITTLTSGQIAQLKWKSFSWCLSLSDTAAKVVSQALSRLVKGRNRPAIYGTTVLASHHSNRCLRKPAEKEKCLLRLMVLEVPVHDKIFLVLRGPVLFDEKWYL